MTSDVPSTSRATEEGGRTPIEEIHARLEEAHGAPGKPERDPLDELVLTILSQNTSDTNRDRAWRSLRDRYPDWEAVRSAASGELEETIRTAGLASQKAATIRRVLDGLAEERGRPDLSHLSSMGDEEALAYLTSFKGVGTKTAACVLCFALRRPVMPVDTHVHRVARRLGLAPLDGGRERTHRALNESVPPDRRFALHVLLIRHGREVCSARRPRCSECVLEDVCPRRGVEASR